MLRCWTPLRILAPRDDGRATCERENVILADDRWAERRSRDILGIRRFASEILSRISGWEPISRRVPLLHPLEPIWLSAEVARRKPSVYFSPGFNPPLAGRAPLVFTIHDLIHLRFPAERRPAQRAYYRLVVLPAARRAATVLTVSEFSKAEIVTWARIPPERVVVTGNGVSDAFTPGGRRHEPGYPYVLYSGNEKPHKNLPGLVRAFARSGLAPDVRLVLTGGPDAQLLELAGRMGAADRLVFAGRLADDELAAFYRGAAAVALPSLYEGFGLPTVEAMASGVPVVAARATALPEVTADAAVLVDPEDVESIADGLRRSVEDDALRDSLRTAGLERARRFTWDAVAERVSAALDSARQPVR
jgi:glycosyltransferase involved in cell wall biosynthesis